MTETAMAAPGVFWATHESARQLGCTRLDTATWGHAWIRSRLEGSTLGDATLLDLGSGVSHPLMDWYLGRVKEAVLVDLMNTSSPHPRARILKRDLERPLPLPDESADVVVSASVLEHLSEAGRVLQMREIQRILKPGGRAVLTVSYLFPVDARALEILARDPWLAARGNQITSKLNLRSMFEAASGLVPAGGADLASFPGYGEPDNRLRRDPSVLTMELRDCEWATFAPQTNALGIRWAEIGLDLVKRTVANRSLRRRIREVLRRPRKRPGRPEQPGARRPVLVHVHLPKNGGTSLNRLLDKSFGPGHVPLYFEEPRRWHTTDTMKEALARHPETRAISSHSFREFPEMIGGHVPLYVCFIRDPAQRHLSYFRYCRKNYATLSKGHRAVLPRDFQSMSMAAFFRWQSERDRTAGATPNRQVRRLSWGDDLQRAIDVLSAFFLVGVTDKLDRGIQLMRRKLEPWGLRLVEGDATRENRTGELDCETREVAQDADVQAYLKNVEADSALYRWAKERFEREATEHGLE